MSQKCLNFIKKRIKGISSEEAKALADAVNHRATQLRNEQGVDFGDAMRDSVEELANSFIHTQRIEKRNTAKNKLQSLRMFNQIKTNFADDPGKGVEAFLVGIEAGLTGARRSVAADVTSAEGAALMGFATDIEKHGLSKILSSKNFDRDIIIAAHRLDVGDDVGDMVPEVIQAAKVMLKHAEAARLKANAAGANIGKLDGWIASQSHDSYKIQRAGRQAWVESISDKLDWEKTLRDVPPDQRGEIMNSLYEQFRSGEHVKATDPTATGFKGPGNIGKSMSHSRLLHFKSPEAAADYHNEFGHGSLADSVTGHLRKSAAKTALMKRLGPNARANYDRVMTIMEKDLLKEGGDLERFRKIKRQMDDLMWPFLDGSAFVPGNKMAANAMGVVRAMETTSKLGFATISAFGDPAFFAAEVSRQGGGFLGGIAQSIGGVFKGVSIAEKQVLSELSVVLDGHIGGVSSRFDPAERSPGMISKITQTYFKLNLLQPWTDRQRTAFALGMSHRLANATDAAHADMDPEMQQILSLYNIGEQEWNLVRKSELSQAGDRGYLTSEGVMALDDATVGSYLEAQGRTASDAAINDTRETLSDALRVAFSDRMTHAVLEGDIKTKGMLLRGTRPGTLEGEGLRSMMLFKSFSAAVLQKAIGAEFFGRGTATTWRGAARDAYSNGAVAGIARTVATATMLGYAAMSVKDMLKGKKPRDPLNPATLKAAALQGGGLGIYGDFLFGDMRNRFGGSSLDTLMGPIFGKAADVVDLMDRVKAGDDAAATSFRLLTSSAPGANLFWTKLPLDYMIMWEMSERMNPGYARRMEQRARKDMDTEFFPAVSPTAAIGR